MNIDDSRIAAMRHQIMTEVTADQRRRTHRLRSGVAAFMGVFIIGGIGIATIPTIGTDEDTTVSSDISDQLPDASPAPPADESFGAQPGEDEAAPGQPPLLGRDGDALPEIARPAVVSQTDIQLVVENPDTAVADVVAWAEEYDGLVDESRESSTDDASPSVTVRIPAASVSDAVQDLESLGEISATDVKNTDVTTDVTDLDVDIRALESSIERLNTIVDDAESTSDVLEAERDLTQREAELEELLAEREDLAEQVAMSGVTVTFDESDEGTGGFTGFLLAALPWVGLVVVAAIVGWFFVRRGRERPAHTSRAVNQWS